jgi:amidase
LVLRAGNFDLLAASVADIQAAVASGALTYEQLVRLYLNRIEAYDKQGPRFNAILEINRRATETARVLDEERRGKGLRTPLHGNVLMTSSWVTYPMMKIVGDLEASLAKYPPIKTGTPDPYVPPR